MADHLVTLSNDREAALQQLVDARNAGAMPGDPVLTNDDLIREFVLAPIKSQIRASRDAESGVREAAFDVATPQVQTEVDRLLGLTTITASETGRTR
jgi:hypothetical protein